MKNMPLKILLVDDEPEALDLMENLLKSQQSVFVVGKAMDKGEALHLILQQQPDVIFQDIQLRDANGLELVDTYRKHHFNGEVVFVTAHSKYAIEAIRKSAYDYLLKPVDVEELSALILRMLADRLKTNDGNQQKVDKLKIPSRTGYTLLNKESIVYCEADGNYTKVICLDGVQHTSSINLGRIEEELAPPIFLRANRSLILNLNFVALINKGEKICMLKTEKKEYCFQISSKTIKILENLI